MDCDTLSTAYSIDSAESLLDFGGEIDSVSCR